MNHRFSGFALLVVSALLYSSPLVSQELGAPRYRSRDRAPRAARVLDSIAKLDQTLRAARRVVVDTTLGGAVWIEFEPTAVPRTARSATPEAAAGRFLAEYGAKVFGIGPAL